MLFVNTKKIRLKELPALSENTFLRYFSFAAYTLLKEFPKDYYGMQYQPGWQ